MLRSLKIYASILLFGCFSNCVEVHAALNWSPVPPAAITGASAGAAQVATTYDSANGTVIAVWLDFVTSIPTYSIWNGTEWSPNPPQTITGAVAATTNTITTSYDAANGTVVVIWEDSLVTGAPTYSVWNGTSWSPAATVTGALSATGVNSTYDAANGTVIATWLDSSTSIPTYSVWNGTAWNPNPPQPITGANIAGSSIATTYDAANGTVVAVWQDFTTTLPTYSVWNGTAWNPNPPQSITGANTARTSFTTVYDAANGTVIAIWLDHSTSIPFYSVWNGSVWSSSAAITGALSVNEVNATYDVANGTVIATFLDGGSSLPAYSIWNGTAWSSVAAITGASPALSVPTITYDGANGTVIAIWVDYKTIIPFYSVWNGASWSPALPNAITGAIQTESQTVNATYDSTNETIIVTWLAAVTGIPTYSIATTLPTAPTSFFGRVVNTRFLSQTDRIYKLIWTPANDPTIVGYLLRRNGILIYQTPATGPYSYEDHNRNKKVPDVYYLTSINQNGVESDPVIVTKE